MSSFCADRTLRSRSRCSALLCALLPVACGTSAPEPEAPPSQLCVVRHAEAFKNLSAPPEGLSVEELDSLTPNGEDQARRLHPALPAGVAFVWSSPAGRARETAAILAGHVGRSAADVGVLDELRQLDGSLSWDARVRAWAAGEDPRPEGGESLADGKRRADLVLQRARAALADGEHGVVVTHGDIVSLLLGELRGTPLLERPTRETLGNGEMVCMPVGRGR